MEVLYGKGSGSCRTWFGINATLEVVKGHRGDGIYEAPLFPLVAAN